MQEENSKAKDCIFLAFLGGKNVHFGGSLQKRSLTNWSMWSCSLFAAFSYGIASMAMVFINKAVLMQYADSMTLLTLQVHLKYIAFRSLLYCLT